MQIQQITNLRNYDNYYNVPRNTSRMSKVHRSFNMSFKGADELVEAAAEGDLYRFKREVESGTKVNAQHEWYRYCKFNCRSAQSIAAQNGHFAIINYLFDLSDFDPNDKDGAGYRGLPVAAENKHYAIVDKYLSHPDIDPNLGSSYSLGGCWGTQRPALLFAAMTGDLRILKSLKTHPKFNPNVTDGEEKSAMEIAMENGHDEFARELAKDPRLVLDFNKPIFTPYLNIAKILNEYKEVQMEKQKQELQEKETILKTREEELLTKEAEFKKEKESFDETIKTKTTEIRKEEKEKAEKELEKRIKAVEKRENEAAQLKVQAEEQNKALDNTIKNYQTLITEDVINARDALAVGYRALYGADSEELPKTMDFNEQTIYVLNVLGKRQDKLTATSSETPNKITKAIQDDTGNISLDGLKFLERAIDACNEKFSEKDLLDSIKCVKGSYGLFDMKKTALFISNISWKDNSIRSVIQKVEKYGLK